MMILRRYPKSIMHDKARYTDWNQREDIKAELTVDLIISSERLSEMIAGLGRTLYLRQELFLKPIP